MRIALYTNTHLLTLCLVSTFLAGIHVEARAWFPQQFRGGASVSEESSKTVQSAASVFVLGNEESNNAQSLLPWPSNDASGNYCVLFAGDNPHQRITNLPVDDTQMVESMCFLCDVVVVVLPDNDSEDKKLEELVPTLMKIAYRRESLSLSKGKLVIVSPSASHSWWVENLVQKRLVQITPCFWESFDVVTMAGLKDQWRGIIGGSNSVQQVLPYRDNAPAFCKLLQQVYQINGGGSEHEFRLQPITNPIKPERKPKVKHHSDTGIDNDNDAIVRQALTEVQSRLEELESKLQEIMLEEQANQIPLLEFGAMANELLDTIYQQLDTVPPSFRLGLLKQVVLELHRLYKDQLQSLRDYFGRRYETALETHEEESEWAATAEHSTEGFHAAAQHAVPKLCQEGGELATIAEFGYIDSLQGLIKDMMEATQLRKDEQSLALEDDDDDDDLFAYKRSRVPKWLEKLAARAFVFGVNYIQGWLAWQSLKRAALERDRNMPKFPLF